VRVHFSRSLVFSVVDGDQLAARLIGRENISTLYDSNSISAFTVMGAEYGHTILSDFAPDYKISVYSILLVLSN